MCIYMCVCIHTHIYIYTHTVQQQTPQSVTWTSPHILSLALENTEETPNVSPGFSRAQTPNRQRATGLNMDDAHSRRLWLKERLKVTIPFLLTPPKSSKLMDLYLYMTHYPSPWYILKISSPTLVQPGTIGFTAKKQILNEGNGDAIDPVAHG